MSKNIIFAPKALKEYEVWISEDVKTAKKIIRLIKDIQRDSFNGLGHPEPLKHDFSGYWSREINQKDRLVYKVLTNGDIEIAQCKGHYND